MFNYQIFCRRNNTPPVIRIPLYNSSFALSNIDHTTTNITIKIFDSASSTIVSYASADMEAISTLGTYQTPSANKIRVDTIGSATGGLTEFHITGSLFTTSAKYLDMTVSRSSGDPNVMHSIRIDLSGNFDVDGDVSGSVINTVGSIASGGISGASFTSDTGFVALHSGTAQTGSTSSTIKLAAGASATDDLYNGAQVRITSSTGVGQAARTITDYDGTSKVATISPDWITTPSNTSQYFIFPLQHPKTDASLQVTANGVNGNVTGSVNSVVTGVSIATGGITRASFAADTGMQTLRSGTCQSGSTSTTTKLDAGASATDHFYEGCAVYITGGTGANQPPLPITGYVGSTKVCTHPTQWFTTPDNTSTFAICKAVYGSNTIIFV